MSPSIRDGLSRVALAVLLVAVATGAASARNEEKLMIPVGHAQVVLADDAVKTVAIAEPKIADAAVGSERTVVVNGKAPGSTSLVVYGEGGRFRVYEVEVFTPNADKQVALHVRVAEVNEQAVRDLGFDLYGVGVKDGVPMQGALLTAKNPGVHSDQSGAIDGLAVGPNADGFFAFTSKAGDLAVQTTWRALEQKGDLRVLANPTLVARSGEKASFLAGGEFPVPISSSGASNQVTVTILWKEYGVKVDFTPTVLADGSIDLVVAPEVSQLDFTQPLTLNGFTVPSVNTRKTSTTVRINPGEHLVIGGLKQNGETKVVHRVPILGQLPILGLLFSSTHTEKTDRELMVVVSPEMIDQALQALPPLPTDAPKR